MNSTTPSQQRAQHRRDVQIARDQEDALWRGLPNHAELDAALARFAELARERWTARLARAVARGNERSARRARRELYLLGM